VGRWTKRPGEPVAKDDVLVELETDKITVEVAAPAAGTLGDIAKNEGDTVGLNELLGSIEEGVPAAAAAPASTAAATPAAAEPASESGNGQGAPPATSPSVRRIAAEQSVDVGQVAGTGPRGRITKDDMLRHVEGGAQPAAAQPAAQPAAPPAPAKPAATPSQDGRETRERMSRRRQTIARRLVEAQQTTASLTTFNELDLSAVMELRKRRQDAFVERYGVKLGFMSFFTKAVIAGLRAFPRLNAEIQGDEFVLKQFYDIGIAVGAEEGLVVPVVRDADHKSFAEIERTIGELGKKAKDGKLALEDLQGGTFTITNGGIFGSMLSTPILNPPQVGILGMHNIVQRPMVVDGEIRIRPMMYVALTYDHRIVDGREAVQFLVRVKQMLEDPEAMLLEG
jgi:2-oxoglutarate dehydrogenase E2 component (dihydrolipoamide succinyltransferase)